MLRRTLAVCLLALVLAGCGLGPDDPDKPMPSSGTGTTASLVAYDRTDPKEERCEIDAEDVPGTTVVVYEPSKGRFYGRLTLRHSVSCQTAWGRVTDIAGVFQELHIDAHRPADGASAPFATTDASPTTLIAFGDMLSLEPGCVSVSAYITGGPVASTPCSDP